MLQGGTCLTSAGESSEMGASISASRSTLFFAAFRSSCSFSFGCPAESILSGKLATLAAGHPAAQLAGPHHSREKGAKQPCNGCFP